uniref:Uncharacterized protein n=1 Tax=Acanthochromis polyacanthus TaxID=80966 RepID=A0A3Q1EGL5_9TELE
RQQCRKRKRTEQSLKAKRLSDRQRSKRKVHLGQAFQRWREFREQKGFKSDAGLAVLLIDRYVNFSSLLWDYFDSIPYIQNTLNIICLHI